MSKHFTTFNVLAQTTSNRVSYSTHLTSEEIDSKRK